MRRSTQSFNDVRKFDCLRSNEESSETSNGSNTVGNGVSRGSTSVAWWWGVDWGGLVLWWGWAVVSTWARWDNSGGVDWRRNWGVSWDWDWSSWAVGRGDGGSIAVVLSRADGGVVSVCVGWDWDWGLAWARSGGLIWSWDWSLGAIWSWGLIWGCVVDSGGVDSWDVVRRRLSSAGGDGVSSRGVGGSWAVGHIVTARSNGDLGVAGVGDLADWAVLSWGRAVWSWGSCGWGGIDGLAGWGSVSLGAGLDGSVDCFGRGVVDWLLVVRGERTGDGGGGGDEGGEMHFDGLDYYLKFTSV